MGKFARRILKEMIRQILKDSIMQFQGAVIKEQGITFAIVIVKPNVLDVSSKREEVRQGFIRFFPQMPIILMAQNGRGTPTFHGRTDVVKFLTNIDQRRIPWKRYSAN
jgi:hypothetical protein